MTRLYLLTALAALAIPGARAADAPPPAAAPNAQVTATAPGNAPAPSAFAVVDGVTISVAEYDNAWVVAQRQKFYHRQAPEAEVLELRREVGDRLIDRVLLTREVERRGIAEDGAKVQAQIAAYEQRYGASPRWPTIQAEMLPRLRAEFVRQSRLERLEAQVRTGAPATTEQARGFYERHPELFTEPEQVRLSLILLKLDPSSPGAVRRAALEEAAAIRGRIDRGVAFADLARLHSADNSADKGGDMGYLHRGMLPEGISEEIDKLAPNTVSAPLSVLEGVALIRVDDRRPARLRTFESVAERAGQLWGREDSERRWNAFLATLRAGASIAVIDPSRLPARAEPRQAP